MADEKPGRGSILIDPDVLVKILLALLVVAIWYYFYRDSGYN